MIKDLISESKCIGSIKWYANNCIFSYNAMKYRYKDYIAEGDKTIVPFKHFLLGFIKYMKETNKQVGVVEFFLIRDFPVLRKDHKEPYDQIFKNEKIDKKYQHKYIHPYYRNLETQNSRIYPYPLKMI